MTESKGRLRLDSIDNDDRIISEDGQTWCTALLRLMGFQVIGDVSSEKEGGQGWAVCTNCQPFRGMRSSSVVGHVADNHRTILSLLKGSRGTLKAKISALQLLDTSPSFERASALPILPLLPVLKGEVCTESDCRKVFSEGTSATSKAKHAHKTLEPCFYQSYSHSGPFRRVARPEPDRVPVSSMCIFDRLLQDTLSPLGEVPSAPASFKTSTRNTLPYIVHAGFERFLGLNASEAGRKEVYEICRLAPKSDPKWGWLKQESVRFFEAVDAKARGMPYHLLSIFNGIPM